MSIERCSCGEFWSKCKKCGPARFNTDTDEAPTQSPTDFEKDLDAVLLEEIKEFLMEKNRQYGDSALNPVRVLSKADTAEQIKVRMDDKLNRLLQGKGGDEDVMKDLVGYWVLLRIVERRGNNA